MSPQLAELIAYCRANGLQGSYRVKWDGQCWRARIRIDQIIHSGGGDTRDAALDRVAAGALDSLLDPMPVHGTDEYVAWEARQSG